MNKSIILDEITGLKKELEDLLPITEEVQDKLNKKFRLEFQYNTNHIEGNTLTYSETELLLIFGETRGSHTFREQEEMKGSDLAFELIRELSEESERPLTEVFIKNINQILLVRPYWKDAITSDGQETRRKIVVGDYKKYSNSVRLDNGEIFHYASPTDTPQLMGELLEWFNAELLKREMHPLEIAAKLHHKFVLIHPFDDGNGRISRLLLNYVLFIFGYPPLVIKSEDKVNYLRALRDADTGNIESFISYLAGQLLWSLKLSIKAAKNESIDELDDWRKDLKLLKQELDGSEEIKIKKSTEVLVNLINNQILPLGKKIDEELSDVHDLFLSHNIYYSPINTISFFNLDNPIQQDLVEKRFAGGVAFYIMLKEFRKKIDLPFNVEIRLFFFFDIYMYSANMDNQQIFLNLYHQPISENKTKELVSLIGTSILENIRHELG